MAGLVVEDTPVHVLARETGLVFQDPDSQFCTLTVDDEIAFGLENLQTPPGRDRGGHRPGAGRRSGWPASARAAAQQPLRRREAAGGPGRRPGHGARGCWCSTSPRPISTPRPPRNSSLILRRLAADRRHTIVIIEHKLDEVIEWVDSVLVLDGEGGLLYRGDPRGAFYDHAERARGARASGGRRPSSSSPVCAQAGWQVPGRPLAVGETVAALQATPALVDRLRVGSPAGGPGRRAPAGGRVPARRRRCSTVRDLSFRYPGGHAAARRRLALRLAAGLPRHRGRQRRRQDHAGLAAVRGACAPARDRVPGRDGCARRCPAWAVAEKVGHVFQNPEHQFVADTVRGELAFSLSPRGPRRFPPSERRAAAAGGRLAGAPGPAAPGRGEPVHAQPGSEAPAERGRDAHPGLLRSSSSTSPPWGRTRSSPRG